MAEIENLIKIYYIWEFSILEVVLTDYYQTIIQYKLPSQENLLPNSSSVCIGSKPIQNKTIILSGRCMSGCTLLIKHHRRSRLINRSRYRFDTVSLLPEWQWSLPFYKHMYNFYTICFSISIKSIRILITIFAHLNSTATVE